MKHKKLLNFFAAAVVLCLALTGQAFAADASQNIATRAAGVSVRGRVTSYLPGVSCTVQLRQGDAVRYSTASFPGVGTGKGTQEFIIPGVADGVYDLVITKPGHLNYTIRNIVVQGSDVDLTTNDNDLVSDITLVAGDFNSDGCVDLRDLVIITSSENFGKSPVVTVFDNGAADNPEDLTDLDDFYYEITATGIRITGVKDPTKTEYVIPGSVTSIAGGAFQGCTNLESITLPFIGETKNGTENTHFGYIFGASAYANNKSYVPASLKTVVMTGGTSIGDFAFSYCSSLTSVTIGNSVTSIGNSAFRSCTSLASITIPDSVTSIGNYAFFVCTSMTSVTIPNSVTYIGHSVFQNCTSLTSVTIPSSVRSIEWNVFDNCTSLTSITIPNSVTYIGHSVFQNCTSLTSVVIPDRVTSIERYAFRNCSNLTSIAIPESVTTLGDSVFDNCTSLTSITIPGSVTSIGEYAFYNCRSLTSVTIPDGVTSIGQDAFFGCSGLTSVTIPDSVTSIGGGAFFGCSGLTSVTISNSVTSIGKETFYNCSSLTSVTIPDSVKSIENETFYNCTSLTSITIPDSVISIGKRAFYNCTNLTSIKYGGTQAQWEAITKGTDWDLDTGNYTITYEGEPTGLDDFYYETTEDGITITGVKDKTKTAYVIPDSVTKIGDRAFYKCTRLTSITIPDSVTTIGTSAFSGCSSLMSITIPNSVMSIGAQVFYCCNSLTSIKYRGIESQWEAITKGYDWDTYTGNYTITYNYTGE